MSEIPDDIMKAAEKAFKYGFGLRYEVAIEAIARAILAERERCASEVCYPADWHIHNSGTSELLEDIRERIRTGAP